MLKIYTKERCREMGFTDETVRFDFDDSRKRSQRNISYRLSSIRGKGYNRSIKSSVISFWRPAYIPRYRDARNLICRLNRMRSWKFWSVIEAITDQPIMRIMGLDVGSRTVGVAVSDPMGWQHKGIEIIRINEDEGNFGYDRLAELVKRIWSLTFCGRTT